MSTVLTTSGSLSIQLPDSRLPHARFFYLWGLDPAFGHCLCPRGSWHVQGAHGEAFGGSQECSSPGKHPYWVVKDGQAWGFRHGVKDAMPYEDLIRTYGPAGGSRRLAMSLAGVMMIDIDSDRGMRSFYRIRYHVPPERVLGIAKTRRGWHLYLACDPVWNQRALTAQMRRWLGDTYSAVDESRIPLRGFLLDARTGANRYAVWPSGDRRWATSDEFRAALSFAGQGMPSWWIVPDGALAPWHLELTQDVRDSITRTGAGAVSDDTALAFDGSDSDRVMAWNELERWSVKISTMSPDTGRNNLLNQTAYYAGADAIAAGHNSDQVTQRLLSAAQASNTPGARATVRSGLSSGLRDRHAQR